MKVKYKFRGQITSIPYKGTKMINRQTTGPKMRKKTQTLFSDSLSKNGHRTSVFLRPLCSLSSSASLGMLSLSASLSIYALSSSHLSLCGFMFRVQFWVCVQLQFFRLLVRGLIRFWVFCCLLGSGFCFVYGLGSFLDA